MAEDKYEKFREALKDYLSEQLDLPVEILFPDTTVSGDLKEQHWTCSAPEK